MTTDDTRTINQAAFYVESLHHFHGIKCLCGFESHRSRARTEHITQALIAKYEELIKEATR